VRSAFSATNPCLYASGNCSEKLLLAYAVTHTLHPSFPQTSLLLEISFSPWPFAVRRGYLGNVPYLKSQILENSSLESVIAESDVVECDLSFDDFQLAE
jgi:hypothetical protein